MTFFFNYHFCGSNYLDISEYDMLFNAICVAIHCSLCQQHPSLQPLSSLWSQLRSSILWSFPSSCLPPALVRIIPLLFFANNDFFFLVPYFLSHSISLFTHTSRNPCNFTFSPLKISTLHILQLVWVYQFCLFQALWIL